MQTKLQNQITKIALSFVESGVYLAVFFLPISKAMIEVGTSLAVIIWFILKLARREDFLAPKSMLKAFFPFLILAVLSAFWINPEYSDKGVRGALKYLQYMGFLVVIMEFFKDDRKKNQLCLIFLLSMTLVTVNGFYQLYTGTDFLRNVSLDPGRIARMKSSLGAANALAAFYFFAIPLSIHFMNKLKKYRYLFASLLLLFIVGFVFTYSRSAFFALILCFFVFLLFQKRFLLAGGILVSIFTLILLIEPLRFNFIESISINDASLKERLQFWSSSWELIRERPLFGHGANSYYSIAPKINLPQGPYQGYAHNSYLQMWVELGLVGLTLFSLGTFNAFRTNLKQFMLRDHFLSLSQSLWIGTIAFLLISLIDTHFFALQTAVLFWMFLGLLASEETKKTDLLDHPQFF